MSTLNIAGIIFLMGVLAVGFFVRRYTRKRLRDLDGAGAIHKQESEDDKGIYL